MRAKVSAVLCASLMMGMLFVGNARAVTECASWGTSTPPATGTPSAPTNLSIVPSSTKLDLTWDAVTGAILYWVAYTDCLSAPTESISGSNSASLAGLTNGTTYQVKVAAQNATGKGAYTAVQEVTVGAPTTTTTTAAPTTTTTTAAPTTTTTTAAPTTTTTTAAPTTTTTTAAPTTTTTTAAPTTTTTTAAPTTTTTTAAPTTTTTTAAPTTTTTTAAPTTTTTTAAPTTTTTTAAPTTTTTTAAPTTTTTTAASTTTTTTAASTTTTAAPTTTTTTLPATPAPVIDKDVTGSDVLLPPEGKTLGKVIWEMPPAVPSGPGVKFEIPGDNTITKEDGTPFSGGKIMQPIVIVVDKEGDKPTFPETWKQDAELVKIELGAPGEKLVFTSGKPAVLTLDVVRSTTASAFKVYFVPVSGSPELAGIDGVSGGQTYAKGGTILSSTVDTPVVGKTTFKVGVLLDHMSTYVAASVLPATSSTTAATASSGGSSGCFIATAAFGSPIESRVMTLRNFRDKYLLTNAPGKAFVQTYYHYSPPMADFIANHDSLRAMTRGALLPLIGVSSLMLYTGMGWTGLSVCIIGIAGMMLAGTRIARRLPKA